MQSNHILSGISEFKYIFFLIEPRNPPPVGDGEFLVFVTFGVGSDNS